MNPENMGKILSINISSEKGCRKIPVLQAMIDKGGISGDAHRGNWHRQISLLAFEKFEEIRKFIDNIKPGDFAENLTIEGIDLDISNIGDVVEIFSNQPKESLKLQSEPQVIMQITQKGKECHSDCEISKITGRCIMPEHGIFCRVIKEGKIKTGDFIVLKKPDLNI